MTIFMLKVLGSGIFWIVYFVVNFVVGGAVLKNITPNTWKIIKNPSEKFWGRKYVRYRKFEIFLFIISIYLFWPIILFAILIGFIFSKILFPMLRKAVLYSGDIIPDIEIKTKTKED